MIPFLSIREVSRSLWEFQIESLICGVIHNGQFHTEIDLLGGIVSLQQSEVPSSNIVW
jgi:hypothetical protein